MSLARFKAGYEHKAAGMRVRQPQFAVYIGRFDALADSVRPFHLDQQRLGLVDAEISAVVGHFQRIRMRWPAKK